VITYSRNHIIKLAHEQIVRVLGVIRVIRITRAIRVVIVIWLIRVLDPKEV
jgi:hypothetical protein